MAAKATESKTILNFPFIDQNKLVQDQILLVNVNGQVQQTQANVVLIENIWDDLLEGSSVKHAKKDSWYWEYEITDMEDTDKTVKVHVEAPIPGPEVFGFNFEEGSGDSDWAAYWKAKMKAVEDSPYNNQNALKSKEITIPETTYMESQNGEFKTLEEQTITRSEDGFDDLAGLMMSIY